MNLAAINTVRAAAPRHVDIWHSEAQGHVGVVCTRCRMGKGIPETALDADPDLLGAYVDAHRECRERPA